MGDTSVEMRSDKRELDKIFKRRDRCEIPDWQRDEVWDVPRKQKLIDSILRGWSAQVLLRRHRASDL
jgi:hypothetical protein